MFNYRISFVSPGWLLLLAVLPLMWWHAWRTLRLMGRLRRLTVIGLRSLVIALLAVALAEIQMVRISDRLTVIYLLDQSMSIPEGRRKAMVEYVNAEVRKHWREGDRAGVIVFGRDAAIEVPPYDEPVQMLPQVESLLDAEFTNLAAAIKLAQASFPEDAAKRIVVVSDGNQNLGNALEQAEAAAAAGIGIDALPVRYRTRAEVIVERVGVPEDVRRGQPFDLRVVVNNTAEATAADPGVVRGRLAVYESAGDQPRELTNEPVELPPGKKVFSIRQTIHEPNFYRYEARFVPDRPEDDAMPQNNRATAFTHVKGKGQVLLIEDHENPGEFLALAQRLRAQELEVTERKSNNLFSSLAELQLFDTVLLANVPREQFSDDQIAMLVRNTQQMGAGLVMLGGPNSFGAGGWTGTEVEKAMPVDFQIRSAKVVPRGALVMIMHASEIAEGNYWQKRIAREAIGALGAQDYCGLIHWNGAEQWLWKGGLARVGENRQKMLARTDQMTPGDMPFFDPAMQMAAKGFGQVTDAAARHMIIISDGDPSPPSGGVLRQLQNLGVTVSTVAVGAHGPAESGLLQRIATQLGGTYYQVTNNKALPRIFQREARRVARPLIYDKAPIAVKVSYPHEMAGSLRGDLPPIGAFVLTSKKEGNPLVETVVVAPEVASDNQTLLAGWSFGLGKAVAFTSDCGARWTKDWLASPAADVFAQSVRWSMRPAGEAGKFATATEIADGKVRLIVTALDKNDEFLNFLRMSATVVGPDLKPAAVKVEQTAPGRYVASFSARDAGSYFISVSPGAEMAPIRAGVSVPYSDEFRDRLPNDALMTQLAAATPKGGAAGVVIQAADGTDRLEQLLAFNTFRHDLPKATSSQDIWHHLVLVACCVFLADVFCRRVQVGFGWVGPLTVQAWNFVLRREPAPAKVEYIERLRSRKAAVSGQIEQVRAAARFEPAPDRPSAAGPSLLDEAESAPTAARPPKLEQQATEAESYTERLLKAKRRAREDREL